MRVHLLAIGRLAIWLWVLLATPIGAQQASHRFVRLEAGQVTIHRARTTGAALALRFGRSYQDQHVRLESGITVSSAGYATFELGPELRLAKLHPVIPFAGIGTGAIAESDWFGLMFRFTYGLDVALTHGIALRIGQQLAFHGTVGSPGPSVLFGGIEWH